VLLQWGEDDEGNEGEGAAARTRRLHIIDTFHTYVRPTWRPTLSAYCTSLTGIEQARILCAWPSLTGRARSMLLRRSSRCWPCLRTGSTRGVCAMEIGLWTRSGSLTGRGT
jgi:hypothetical protein